MLLTKAAMLGPAANGQRRQPRLEARPEGEMEYSPTNNL